MRRRVQRLTWFQKYKKYIYIGSGALALGVASFVITVLTYQEKPSNELVKKDPVIIDEYAYQKDESSIRLNPEAIHKSEEDEPKEEKKEEVKPEPVVTKKEEEVNTVEVSTIPIKKEITFDMPLDGEIILEYAKDKLVYSNTLEEWTTHDGIDIKGEEAEPIKASADGKIKDKKVDPRYGNTIMIEHDDGYKTIYANLSTLDLVQVGQEVKKGEIISGVGAGYGFEVEEGSHIHFEIQKDGEAIDFSTVKK